MTHTMLTGFIVLQVARFEDGALNSIRFLNQDTGFGLLSEATVFEVEPGAFGEGVEVLKCTELLNKLIDLTGNRAEIMKIEDFSEAQTDIAGAPCVIEQELRCKGCETSWTLKVSTPKRLYTCPKCASRVAALRIGAIWIGPIVPLLHDLWQWLPMPRAQQLSCSSGFEITETIEGFVVSDKLGHRIRVCSTVAGFTAFVLRRGCATPAKLEVDAWAVKFEDDA